MRDRLYRSRDERVLFGVAGGVAEWLDVDPALVRIVFALLVLTAGIGFLLYIIMAIVILNALLGFIQEARAEESVRALMAQLPQRERTIIYMRYFKDLTQAEISERIGVSQVHISRLLRQTLDRLGRTTMPNQAGRPL